MRQNISKRKMTRMIKLLVSRHLSKGLIELLSDGLELVLLAQQLVLQPVNLGKHKFSVRNAEAGLARNRATVKWTG